MKLPLFIYFLLRVGKNSLPDPLSFLFSVNSVALNFIIPTHGCAVLGDTRPDPAAPRPVRGCDPAPRGGGGAEVGRQGRF